MLNNIEKDYNYHPRSLKSSDTELIHISVRGYKFYIDRPTNPVTFSNMKTFMQSFPLFARDTQYSLLKYLDHIFYTKFIRFIIDIIYRNNVHNIPFKYL